MIFSLNSRNEQKPSTTRNKNKRSNQQRHQRQFLFIRIRDHKYGAWQWQPWTSTYISTYCFSWHKFEHPPASAFFPAPTLRPFGASSRPSLPNDAKRLTVELKYAPLYFYSTYIARFLRNYFAAE